MSEEIFYILLTSPVIQSQRALLYLKSVCVPLISIKNRSMSLMILHKHTRWTSKIDQNQFILLPSINSPNFIFIFDTISDEITEMNQLRENLLAAKQELRNFSEQLNLEKEDSRKKLNSLKLQLENMTQHYHVSEGKNTEVKNEIQELKENFTKQITDLEDKWEKFNVSRAQWTIDSYCPADTSKVRTCSACQKGWTKIQKSCIVLHNSEAPPDPKTWEEARENCRGRGGDLVVVHDEEEKNVIDGNVTTLAVPNGYWMGLRVEGGTWKWINGTDLMNASWIEPPAEGHCAVSLGNKGWTSVKCDEKRTRICSQKALSV
ncbi:C-type lectin domain family 10 member A-like isoform X1 [Gasterosteus aculeatus]